MSATPKTSVPHAQLTELVPHPEDRALLQPHLEQGWTLAGEEHPLAELQGQPITRCTPLVLLGPENRVGARYFQLYLLRDGRLKGDGPALTGLYYRGRYPQHSWVEVMTTRTPKGAEEEKLFQALGQTILPGGHLMVEYESPGRRKTERALSVGVPPLLTPLGAALFRAGCGYGFKDWYISEGGSEGPRKLQGYKPLDEEHRLKKADDLAKEALQFLKTTAPQWESPLFATARRLARQLLPLLPVSNSAIRAELQEWVSSR